jgi:ATP-dependent Clp protease ATP-binding subunit ClpA
MLRFLVVDRLAHLLVPRETAPRVVRQFAVEAKQDGAKCIEAEHMLLTLAADSASDAGLVLVKVGLNYQQIAAALRDERRRTLAFAGVEALGATQTAATELDTPLTLGTSAKMAVKRALVASRDSRSRRPRIQSTDLLLGILQAEFGTVPRTLVIAGVDRAALIAGTWNLMSKARC